MVENFANAYKIRLSSSEINPTIMCNFPGIEQNFYINKNDLEKYATLTRGIPSHVKYTYEILEIINPLFRDVSFEYAREQQGIILNYLYKKSYPYDEDGECNYEVISRINYDDINKIIPYIEVPEAGKPFEVEKIAVWLSQIINVVLSLYKRIENQKKTCKLEIDI